MSALKEQELASQKLKEEQHILEEHQAALQQTINQFEQRPDASVLLGIEEPVEEEPVGRMVALGE